MGEWSVMYAGRKRLNRVSIHSKEVNDQSQTVSEAKERKWDDLGITYPCWDPQIRQL